MKNVLSVSYTHLQDNAHQNGNDDAGDGLVCAEDVELLSSGNALRGHGGDQLDHEEEGVADAEHDADLLAQTCLLYTSKRTG